VGLAILFALASGLSAPAGSAPVKVPLYTHELALKREPRPFPFTAIYSRDAHRLAFVAAKHENGDDTATATSIRHAFDLLHPDLVILEGFPARLGENPPQIVAIASSRGAPGANPFASSETMLAANMAIKTHVPFVGGEPSDKQQVEALEQGGFTAPEIMFADLLKVFPQFIRSGVVTGPADPKFASLYDQLSATIARNRGEQPMPWSEFEARYRTIFGTGPAADPMLASRPIPSAPTLVGRLLAAEGQVRDQAIFSLIRDALATHRSVLIVYGGSHWTTLSDALERQLGRPTIV
jgi:hypothetical protein